MKTLKYRGTTYKQKYGHILKPLTPAERERLKASVLKFGIRMPITTNTTNDVIDGWHRLELAAELDIDCPQNVLLDAGLEEDAAYELNLARRHIDATEMAEIIEKRRARVAESRCEGQSLRTIAEAEGVSEKTIRNDLESGAEGVRTDPENGKIVGRDGVEQPASKPEPKRCFDCKRLIRVGKPLPKKCETCKELNAKPKAVKKPTAPKPPTELPQDSFGVEIPKRCRDAWADQWIETAIENLKEMAEAFRSERFADGMNKRKKHYPFFIPKDFIDGCGMIDNTFDLLIDHLESKRPAGVCPACEGKGCPDCVMSGLVPADVHKKLSRAKK